MKLSICIPTYNFGSFIAATLDSILADRPAGVEIVVLDGGSTDNTEEVMQRYTSSFDELRYVRQPQRGGIDRDMARSVDLARGEYCWLFSSDDIMKPGALRRVLQELDSGYDVYLGGLTICDLHMRPLREHPVLDAIPGSVFHLEIPAERREFFRKAITTTAFFSFMGSIVIRRDRWLSEPLAEDFVGSCWAHVVRIFRLMPRGLSVKYVGYPLLLKRSENDSFMDRGIAHRFAIAIEGYQRIARELFGDESFEARQIRRVIVNEFPPNAFFSAKLQSLRASRPADLAYLNRLADATYRDRNLRNLFLRIVFASMSVAVYEFARRQYRRLRHRRDS